MGQRRSRRVRARLPRLHRPDPRESVPRRPSGFLAFYALLLFGRAIWLGDPLTIPVHQLQNGALLIFAFFMISDPKTTPNTAVGRLLYAMLVAAIAYTIQFVFYEPHGPIIALIIASPVVPAYRPLIQRKSLSLGTALGPRPPASQRSTVMKVLAVTLSAVLTIALSATAQAFCGFYVAKADTSLFNRASQVVLVRDDDRTVITMANDFEGDVKDFAVVVPVPTFIERGQINVGDKAVIDHLDAYTSPRLVEYFDPDPCAGTTRAANLPSTWPPANRPGCRPRRARPIAGCDDRGQLHGRRVRHTDPLGRGK